MSDKPELFRWVTKIMEDGYPSLVSEQVEVYWYCEFCTPAGRECDAAGIEGEGHWAVDA